MNIYNSEDKLVKRIDSISDDMARFISKEGCNQFPTVLFLINRMFVSDEINLITDLNLGIKLKKGDNYYWYKSSSFYENLQDVIKYILPNTKLFVTKTSPISDIKRIFNIDGIKNYFLTSNKLYYGSIDNYYEIPFGFNDIGDILNIFTIKENTDCILTKHNIYFIDISNKTVSKKYSDDSVTFKDICYSGDTVVLATSKRGKVLTGLSTGNLTYDYDLEYYFSIVPSIDPDGLDISTTNTNGMPPDENVDRCFISGDYIYIGNSTTIAKFKLGESSDYGVKADVNVDLHRCKGNSEIICKSVISVTPSIPIVPGENIQIKSTYTFKGKTITTIDKTYTDLLVEDDAIFAISGSTIDCYNNGGTTPLFTFNTSNGFDSIKDLAFDINDNIIILSNSNKLYETIKINDAAYPIKFLPIKFIFDEDKDTKVLNCENKTLSIREMILCSLSSTKYDSVLGKSNGQKATFMCIYVKKSNVQTFIYFGNDNRQEKAIAVKKCCDAFDIG